MVSNFNSKNYVNFKRTIYNKPRNSPVKAAALTPYKFVKNATKFLTDQVSPFKLVRSNAATSDEAKKWTRFIAVNNVKKSHPPPTTLTWNKTRNSAILQKTASKIVRKVLSPYRIPSRSASNVGQTPLTRIGRFKLVKKTKLVSNQPKLSNVRQRRLSSSSESRRFANFTPFAPRNTPKNKYRFIKGGNTSIGGVTSLSAVFKQKTPTQKRAIKVLRRSVSILTLRNRQSRIPVCSKFLRGACKSSNCKFSHEPNPDQMPLCRFYLQGVCGRTNCPYLHVKHSATAKVCPQFKRGFCASGAKCSNLHLERSPIDNLRYFKKNTTGIRIPLTRPVNKVKNASNTSSGQTSRKKSNSSSGELPSFISLNCVSSSVNLPRKTDAEFTSGPIVPSFLNLFD